MSIPQLKTDVLEDKDDRDERMLKFAEGFGWDLSDREPLSPEKQALLLFILVHSSPTTHASWKSLSDRDLLDRAKAKSPFFDETLGEAWKMRKFSKIRDSVIFRLPFNNAPFPEWVQSGVENQELTTVQTAWEAPYQKNNHRLLYESLRDMKYDQNAHRDYSNTVSILQSSGAGKSRMIDETASLLFAFPFNLRDRRESKYFAYPPPDDNVREYLATYSSNKSELIVRMRYHCFFAHLFDLANAHIQSIISDFKYSHEDLASEWRNYLKKGTNRVEFYAQVLERAEASLEITTKARQSEQEMVRIMTRQAHAKFAELQATIHACKSDTDRRLTAMIYFDESHVLSQLTAENKTAEHKPLHSPYPLYLIMLSVFNSYKELPLVGVFLSTVSLGGNLATSARATASAFYRAPITETPFDCAPDLDIEPYSKTKEVVASWLFTAKFGRPLFWTILQNVPDFHLQSLLWSLMRTARSKLVAANCDLGSNFGSFSTEAHLAVADVRLCLEYEQHPQAVRAQEILVASHAEPFVAEAAAQQLNSWRKSCQTALIYPLITHMKSGLLDKGEREEVAARALLTEAYDRAVSNARKADPPGDENFSKGCSAIDFLEALFPSDIATAVLDSTPENTGNPPLRDALSRAWVRFTHFVRAVDDHAVNANTIATGFIRGMAFICTGQPQVDILIPLLLFGDAKIGESLMSVILVQVKRRSNSRGYDIDAEDLFFFDTKGTELRPHITLFMDLGVPKSVPKHAQWNVANVMKKYRLKKVGNSPSMALTKTNDPQTPSPVSLSAAGGPPIAERLHPRYRIHAYGCSDAVYAVIDEYDNAKWQQLLSFDEFSYDHPRPNMLPSFRNLKPFWALDSYDWLIDDSPDNDSKEEEPEYLGVFVPDEVRVEGDQDYGIR